MTATWTLENMEPGVSETGIQQIELSNVGSISADHLEIACSYTATEGAPNVNTADDPDSFAKYMEITYMVYKDDYWYFDLLTGEKYTRPDTATDWSLAETRDKWIISLYDLKLDPIDDLIPPNGDTQFEMQLKFHKDAGNDLQGDTLNLTMIFTLKQ